MAKAKGAGKKAGGDSAGKLHFGIKVFSTLISCHFFKIIEDNINKVCGRCIIMMDLKNSTQV